MSAHAHSVENMAVEPERVVEAEPAVEAETATPCTWCRACGDGIPVKPGRPLAEFCNVVCRLKYSWRTAGWRL